jgi:hypothetical protein
MFGSSPSMQCASKPFFDVCATICALLPRVAQATRGRNLCGLAARHSTVPYRPVARTERTVLRIVLADGVLGGENRTEYRYSRVCRWRTPRRGSGERRTAASGIAGPAARRPPTPVRQLLSSYIEGKYAQACVVVRNSNSNNSVRPAPPRAHVHNATIYNRSESGCGR